VKRSESNCFVSWNVISTPFRDNVANCDTKRQDDFPRFMFVTVSCETVQAAGIESVSNKDCFCREPEYYVPVWNMLQDQIRGIFWTRAKRYYTAVDGHLQHAKQWRQSLSLSLSLADSHSQKLCTRVTHVISCTGHPENLIFPHINSNRGLITRINNNLKYKIQPAVHCIT